MAWIHLATDCTFLHVVAPAPTAYVVLLLSAILCSDRMAHVETAYWHCISEFIINLYTIINIIAKGIYWSRVW